ncbi:hypothetical protein Scep_023428 [Stephania cephalantha]|uniref:Uncharacterized protein n=1 Tax=Stephania cephalantha TaxID=152367 RepID=A0AAP0F1U3_9MAGN
MREERERETAERERDGSSGAAELGEERRLQRDGRLANGSRRREAANDHASDRGGGEAADRQQQREPGGGAGVGMTTSGDTVHQVAAGTNQHNLTPARAATPARKSGNRRRARSKRRALQRLAAAWWRGGGMAMQGAANGVGQQRGGALPDRSIPDETTTVDKGS